MGKAMKHHSVDGQTREPPQARPLDTFTIQNCRPANSIKNGNNLTIIKFKKNTKQQKKFLD